MHELKISKTSGKKRYNLLLFLLSLVILMNIGGIVPDVKAFAGKICGSASPCDCGTNCSGGNELFGNSQAYCEANKVECFNTIDDCWDGTTTSLNYVQDINISSFNDSVFRVGDVIEIDATLFSSSANTEGVFFVYANGTGNESVNWSVIYSTSFGVASDAYHIKYNYTIPNKVGEHSIRIVDIYNQVTNITCGRHADANYPTYSDTDDISFTVLQQPAPKINFTGPTPSNNTNQTTVTVTINVTHNETHPDTLILYWNGTNESQSYSGNYTVLTKTNLKNGNYSFYVWVNDTFGNTNQTETRLVVVNTPIDITVDVPTANGQYSNNTINLNTTIRPTESDRNITWVRYQLNQDNNVTITTRLLNISADTSDPDGIINESLITFHNLSQSFVPNQLMEIKNISIKLKRTGDPNATIQIRGDNANSPNNTVLANFSIDNSTVSNTEFSWINITFNSTVTLTKNTRYWLFLSYNGSNEDHYDWEASDENISAQGEFYQNGSRDLLFRIFDFYRYRTTFTATEGSNNLTIYANNSDGDVVSSSTITFTSDTAAPTYTGINESEDPVEVGNNITISINVSDASTSVNTVLFEYNGTNYSMTLDIGSRYNYTFEATILGLNNYTFYMNDSLGNLNSTSRYNFTVNDTKAPTFSNIAASPNSSDDLDPNVLINVTVTITDPGVVDTAVLQYKNLTGNWTNVTMQNTSSLYFGNFTPNTVGNWTYRIWANDTTGNANYSGNYSLNISLDYSWTRSPSSFSALSGIKGNVVTIGNLTVNNTGDFLLSFDLTSNQPTFVSFNKTTPFTIEAHNYSVIEVNATTPLTEAEYSIVITVDAENATAEPDSLQTNTTLASISSGPYLFLEIVQYNVSVAENDFIDLKAKITNIGNETATNVVSNWTVPSGWTTIPADLNRTLGTINVNKFEYHNISAIITSSAATGSQTISIYAQSDEGANNTLSKTVSVSLDSTTTTTTTSSEGGGGGGGTGTGGGGIIYTKPDYDILIEALKKIELLTDEKKTFEINITNNVPNTVLRNIETRVSGFLLGKLKIEPELIKELNYGEKETILLTIDIPEYMKHQNITLTLTFTADARDPTDSKNNTRSEAVFEKKFEINLVILEITKEVAQSSLNQAQSDIELIKKFGFNSVQLKEIFSEAEKAFSEKNYKKTKELADKISFLKEKAINVDALIKSTGKKLEESGNKGIDVSEAQEFLQLAIDLFNRGSFEEAEEMVNKAILAGRLSAKTAEAKFLIRIKNFIINYWWILLIVLLIASLTGMLVYKEFSIKAVSNRLKLLDKEEATVTGLIKKAQQQYFKEKIMSDRLYKKTIDQFAKRMTEIQKTKVNLNSKIIGLLKRSNNREALEKEYTAIKQLIKDVQDKYFLKKIITRETYTTSIAEYGKRIAEIEKTLQLLSPKGKPLKLREHEEKHEYITFKPPFIKPTSEPKLKDIKKCMGDDLRISEQISELKARQSKLSKDLNNLRKKSIDATSIRKMLGVSDRIIKKLGDHAEDLNLALTIAAYNKLLKKYGKTLQFKFKFPKLHEFLELHKFPKRQSPYEKVKSNMLKNIKEVYHHGH
jgi:hypothetical protein